MTDANGSDAKEAKAAEEEHNRTKLMTAGILLLV